MSAELLLSKIRERRSPCCVELDTAPGRIPAEFFEGQGGSMPEVYAQAAYRFNAAIIDAVSGTVPAALLRFSRYGVYGPAGADVIRRTLDYARSAGMYTIVEGWCVDSQEAAAASAEAFFGETELSGAENAFSAYPTDALVISAYPGSEVVKPFLRLCERHMLFIAVRSEAKSAFEVQELVAGDRALYRVMASRTERWGADTVGESGYSSVGAVVGGASERALSELRSTCRRTFMLLTGYGTQGANIGEAVRRAFDREGRGALVCLEASRMYASCLKRGGSGQECAKAVRSALERSKREIAEYVTVL